LLRELPNLLSELRDEDIALGALRSLPLSPAQVWNAAVEEAMEKADDEVLGSSVSCVCVCVCVWVCVGVGV
jgi:hypothetical protein